MVDQWRLAMGLTSLVMSMFALSKVVLVVQALFFTYMVGNNGVNCYKYLLTKQEDTLFLFGGVLVFVCNGVWYWSVVINEYFHRVDPEL